MTTETVLSQSLNFSSRFFWGIIAGLGLLATIAENNQLLRQRGKNLLVLFGLLIFLLMVPQVSTETTRLFANPVEEMLTQKQLS